MDEDSCTRRSHLTDHTSAGRGPAEGTDARSRRRVDDAARVTEKERGVDPNDADTSSVPSGGLVGQLLEGARQFMATQVSGAVLMLAATVLALVWANSPWRETYDAFWGTPLDITLGSAALELDLRHWVNDGLMVFFFFVLGLEVKRELVVGELSDPRRAAVPVAAAVAGLVVPALIFLAFNPTGPQAAAWGVVISMDTAFLLGVLALVGPAFSAPVRLFLLTLAVADDIGALTVIAIFYTDDLYLGPLALALAGIASIVLLARRGAARGPVYFVIAVGVWVATVASGVHPTIAGVVIALFTPAFTPRRGHVAEALRLVRTYRQDPGPRHARQARWAIDATIAPTDRLQLLYQSWTSFVVVPVFALANAGVTLDTDVLSSALGSTLFWGVVAGLVVGKFAGVAGSALLAVRVGLGDLAPGLTRSQLAGGAALSGIGFTISLLVVDLALDDDVLADQARIGVLSASVLAAGLGWVVFALGRRYGPSSDGPPTALQPPVDPRRDHVLVIGPEQAHEVTLVEYADFECSFCARGTGVLEEVQAHFGGRLRYVLRHLPLLGVHPHAQLAAQAAEAAGAQDHFWEMHDSLFADQDDLTDESLVRRARELGLDEDRFLDDLDAPGVAARIRDDLLSAEASGAQGTPTYFVNGLRHTGAKDATSLIAALERTAAGPRTPAP